MSYSAVPKRGDGQLQASRDAGRSGGAMGSSDDGAASPEHVAVRVSGAGDTSPARASGHGGGAGGNASPMSAASDGSTGAGAGAGAGRSGARGAAGEGDRGGDWRHAPVHTDAAVPFREGGRGCGSLSWCRRHALIISGVVCGALVVVLVVSAAVASGRRHHAARTGDLPAVVQVHDTPVPPGPRTVIMLSLDGFRWDYFNGRAATPNLNHIMDTGVKARSLKPIFPSKTFPNHYTLVTGLYAESHGIIGNRMYDPVFDAVYTISGPEAKRGRWYGGEPIWVTAVKQGLHSGSVFWPGSEAEIKGARPTYYRTFDSSVTFEQRVDQAMNWLDLPQARRPRLLTLYLDSPDHEGHDFGPESQQTTDAITRVDAAVGHLLRGLEARGLRDDVDLIVTADHGMTSLERSRTIYLDDYVDLSTVDIVTWYPVLGLRPKAPTTAAQLVEQLQGKHPQLQVWAKEDVPARFHYNHNRRVTPVVGLAAKGWAIEESRASTAWFGKGMHGYDNEEADMHAIFLASGPSFKRGYKFGEMQNVDIYALCCHLLGLDPAPNNGTLARVTPLLRDP